MDRDTLAGWIAAYERAWRTAGTQGLGELFAPAARYRPGPFDPEIQGVEAIAEFWDAERDGPDEVFALGWEPVAVEGDTGVARVEVDYGDPPARSYRDLWVVTFDDHGRCVFFEEWPFFPGQPLSATTAGA